MKADGSEGGSEAGQKSCIDTLTRAMARLLDSTRSARSSAAVALAKVATRLKNRDTFAAVFACLKPHFPAAKLFYDLRLDLRFVCYNGCELNDMY